MVRVSDLLRENRPSLNLHTNELGGNQETREALIQMLNIQPYSEAKSKLERRFSAENGRRKWIGGKEKHAPCRELPELSTKLAIRFTREKGVARSYEIVLIISTDLSVLKRQETIIVLVGVKKTEWFACETASKSVPSPSLFAFRGLRFSRVLCLR